MKGSSVIGLFGSVIFLAALAMIVAKPKVVGDFFTGASQLLGTAISPVTGRAVAMRDLLAMMQEPGLEQVPEYLRPYTAPLTQSVAVAIGKNLPSRSGAKKTPTTQIDSIDEPVNEWTPWGIKHIDPHGYRLSSGPSAGCETRAAQGEGYQQNSALWNLSGVATGWSRPFAPTPSSPPTPKMALGLWTPFGGAARPLPSTPVPAQMVRPVLT